MYSQSVILCFARAFVIINLLSRHRCHRRFTHFSDYVQYLHSSRTKGKKYFLSFSNQTKQKKTFKQQNGITDCRDETGKNYF